MVVSDYIDREITPRIVDALDAMPVVVLSGARQTGKTTLLQHDPALRGRRYLTLDDFAVLAAARSAPEELLAGDDPITIDEVQRAPELFVAIKRDVDRRRRPGRYLLSGSANLALLASVTETLAGRALYLVLHPLHRRERQRSIGEPPFLKRLFDDGTAPATTAARFAFDEVLAGGMPSAVLGPPRARAAWMTGYEQTYLERDVRELSLVSDLVAFRTFLHLAALRTAQVLNVSELGRDAKLPAATATRWLGLLEASFLVTRLPPYLRNKASRLIKGPKLCFADSGIASHLAGVRDLGATTEEPMRGALLETWVHQNLAGLLEASWPQARLAYWHVQGRHEVDFVVADGRDSLAVEIKHGTRFGDGDLSSLRAFLATEKRCRAAVLAYGGNAVAPLGDRLWAVPLGVLVS